MSNKLRLVNKAASQLAAHMQACFFADIVFKFANQFKFALS